jgi:tetrapyrrole methylase family protein / MazG family protein
MTSGITIIGLGPGAPEQLTRQAWNWLEQVGEIWLRTTHHPTIAAFPAALEIHSFDDLYDRSEKFEAVYAEIVERVLELGRRPEGVTYAVPGHPYVAEATGPEIVRRAKAEGLAVKVIEGLSFLEPTFTALAIDPYPNLVLVDALELGQTLTPQFNSSQPVLIAQIYSRQVAANVKLTLNAIYPDDHPVRLVHAAGTDQEVVEDLKLYEIDRSRQIGLLSALYLPPLPKEITFEYFQEIIARLRAPDGCPWDREQTHATLRKHLLEETYEALAALDANDPEDMREEFGDLLLQIVLHAQIGVEEGEFSMADILQGIAEKLVRRHPHVFGDVEVEGVKGVLQNWEKLKAAERKEKGTEKVKGLLDGVPRDFPALAQAQELQDRAARVGFDWPAAEAVWTKVLEEAHSAHAAQDSAQRTQAVGDLLFAAAGLARWNQIDSESALRETILRFRSRFTHLEQRARELGKPVSDLKPAEIDILWKESKQVL